MSLNIGRSLSEFTIFEKVKSVFKRLWESRITNSIILPDTQNYLVFWNISVGNKPIMSHTNSLANYKPCKVMFIMHVSYILFLLSAIIFLVSIKHIMPQYYGDVYVYAFIKIWWGDFYEIIDHMIKICYCY